MRTTSELRRCAKDVFNTALKAIDPARLVSEAVRLDGHNLDVVGRRYDLRDVERVFVIAVGKAAAPMAGALAGILGGRLSEGIVVAKYGYGLPLRDMRVIEAGHPVPDKNSVKASKAVLHLAAGAGKRDLVFCLLSGGGSALLCGLPDEITISNLKTLTKLLLASGADIKEMNTVRKHASLINGGRLAKAIYPAAIVNLIVSDVVGDKLDTVASGPTLPVGNRFRDAIDVLTRYGLTKKVPQGVYRYMQMGLRQPAFEGPGRSATCFKRCQTHLLGSNVIALDAAEKRAKALGFNSMIFSSSITGEARQVASVMVSMANEVLEHGRPVKRPACMIAGGETTVTIEGNGLGGRNQEFALAAALELDGCHDIKGNVVVLSGGTDGTDGPTDADGAMVDANTCSRAKKRFRMDAADYLRRNDSYHFFKRAGGHLITGPTRTNVMDIMMALIA